MADRNALVRAFTLLVAGGCRPPSEWLELDTGNSARLATQRVWLELPRVQAISEDALLDACRTWLGSDRSRWWPTPGELLALVPRRDAPQLTDRGDWRSTAGEYHDRMEREHGPHHTWPIEDKADVAKAMLAIEDKADPGWQDRATTPPLRLLQGGRA